jgi:hypothetical protein
VIDEPRASVLQLLGAGGFGAILGWYLYFINRYRSADVRVSDLVTVVGILGGGVVSAQFQPRTDLFGAYGVGLFAGFFGYFLTLLAMVATSDNFTFEWFLDGRRKRPADPFVVPPEMKTPSLPAMEPSSDGSMVINS